MNENSVLMTEGYTSFKTGFRTTKKVRKSSQSGTRTSKLKHDFPRQQLILPSYLRFLNNKLMHMD